MTDKSVVVYGGGPICISVCAPKEMTVEEVAEQVNKQRPTGISSEWRVDKRPTFRGGKPNPCPCDMRPEIRLHWLLSC